MSCSCDRYYEWFEEESRRAEDLEAEVERLRAELEEMTKTAHGAIREAKQQHETYMSRVERHHEALAVIDRVRRYAESRCNMEYQDYASASVILHLLDGELGVVDE